MTFKAKIEGLDEIRKLLGELPAAAEKKAVRDAMIDAADVFANDAAARAPRDKGRLWDSIVRTWRIVKSQARDSRRVGKEEVRAFVGPNYSKTDAGKKGYAPHAHLVEWGTGPRYTKDGTFKGIMRPHPFMRPAFDSKKTEYIHAVTDAILVQINKRIDKLRRKRSKGKT